jgi:hypothetical protein
MSHNVTWHGDLGSVLVKILTILQLDRPGIKSHNHGMITRTGNVIYWVGCLITAVFLFMVFIDRNDWVVYAIFAVISWLVTSVARNILANK